MPPLRTGLLSFGVGINSRSALHRQKKTNASPFNLLHAKCGSRIQNRSYCPVSNVTVERGDLVRGYEFAKNQYVQFTEADLGKFGN